MTQDLQCKQRDVRSSPPTSYSWSQLRFDVPQHVCSSPNFGWVKWLNRVQEPWKRENTIPNRILKYDWFDQLLPMSLTRTHPDVNLPATFCRRSFLPLSLFVHQIGKIQSKHTCPEHIHTCSHFYVHAPFIVIWFLIIYKSVNSLWIRIMDKIALISIDIGESELRPEAGQKSSCNSTINFVWFIYSLKYLSTSLLTFWYWLEKTSINTVRLKRFSL